MKSYKITILALAAMLCLNVSVNAQKPAKKAAKATVVTKSKAKSGKKGAAVATPQMKIDTVSLKDFSYDMGMAQTEGLKNYLSQRMNMDTTKMDDFLRGLNEAFNKAGDKGLGAYAAGLQIGQQVVGQILPGVNQRITDKTDTTFIDEQLFKEGFIAGITKKNMKVSADSATHAATNQMDYYHAVLMDKKYGKNRTDGEKFLAENAKKDSVKIVPGSAVQYKILKVGNGEIPTATSKVKVNYEGRLIDGTVFDSSYKRNKPAEFECGKVIKGWTDALTHMPVGSIWEIYIPQELGYGAQENGSKIPPFSTLIFKVELLSIEK